MQDDKLLEQIESILPELTTENIPLKECSSTSWWQIIQNEYYNNELLLKSIVKVLEEKYHKKYSKEELLYMQKLYLLYPNKKTKNYYLVHGKLLKS